MEFNGDAVHCISRIQLRALGMARCDRILIVKKTLYQIINHILAQLVRYDQGSLNRYSHHIVINALVRSARNRILGIERIIVLQRSRMLVVNPEKIDGIRGRKLCDCRGRSARRTEERVDLAVL